ncbi:hypothetical protein COP2_044505 [Malus domestica]
MRRKFKKVQQKKVDNIPIFASQKSTGLSPTSSCGRVTRKTLMSFGLTRSKMQAFRGFPHRQFHKSQFWPQCEQEAAAKPEKGKCVSYTTEESEIKLTNFSRKAKELLKRDREANDPCRFTSK